MIMRIKLQSADYITTISTTTIDIALLTQSCA